MEKINNQNILNEYERVDKNRDKDFYPPISISKILTEIEEGNWVIPEFQRDFVWSIDKFKLLFDSIFKGYTIGNLLLWKSKEDLAYKKVGSKEITKNNNKTKELFYILDGQQRLTTLYGILKGKKLYKKDRKNAQKYTIFYDVISSKFLYEKDKIKIKNIEYKIEDLIDDNPFRFINLSHIFDEKLKFPNNIIENQRKKIEEESSNLQEYKEKSKILDENKEILDKFSEVIKSYKIHQIVEDSELDKVVTIFERINTQNVKLDIFDIMIAKTYKEITYVNVPKTFNLRYAIQKVLYPCSKVLNDKLDPEIPLNYEKDAYYNIDNTTTLRLISIIKNLNDSKISGLQKEHIYKLEAQYIQDNITEFRNILGELLKYFSNELNIKTLDTKYTDNKILSFLTAVISSSKYSTLTKEGKIDLINKWFWNTMIFNRYPGAQLQRIEADIKQFNEEKKAFSEQIKNNRNFGILNKKISFNNKYLIDAGYDKQNSLYKALILLLNSLKPIDFNANSEINLMDYFGANTKNNKHHIIPFKSKAADELRKKLTKGKAEILLNSIGNIAIISFGLNQEIKAKNPEEYFKDFENSHQNFNEFLERHLIDQYMYKILVEEKDYEKFILLRTEAILELIKKKCSINNEVLNFGNHENGEEENDD